MGWCPNCKTEYQKGITICNVCNEVLVEKLESNKELMEAMEPQLLYSSSDQMQAVMVISLLEDAKIPILVKDVGSGGYMKIYMGYSVFGSDIYVDKYDYPAAKELLDTYMEEMEDVSEDTKEDNKHFLKKRRFVARIVLGILFIPPIALFLANQF